MHEKHQAYRLPSFTSSTHVFFLRGHPLIHKSRCLLIKVTFASSVFFIVFIDFRGFHHFQLNSRFLSENTEYIYMTSLEVELM